MRLPRSAPRPVRVLLSVVLPAFLVAALLVGGPTLTALAAGGGGAEGQPTAAEIEAAKRAADLKRTAQEQSGTVGDAKQSLEAAADRASAALQAYRTAVLRRESLETRARRQKALLGEAGKRLEASRAALGRWARDAYVNGGSLSSSPGAVALLEGGTTDDAALTEAAIGRVADTRAKVVADLADAEQAQRTAAEGARVAADGARAAVADAQRAKVASDRAVATQRQVLRRLEAQLGSTNAAARGAREKARRLRQARAIAERAEREASRTKRRADAAASCPGGDLSGYGNGRLPVSALCRLWGSPGHRLRADAAAAFNRLSKAYAEEFGSPVCITDSYRSYAAQVSVARRKPGLAAKPGTSNHGWGTATDLCGGIQTFGSSTHRWMQRNASAYGWFHPSWARAGGSKPEPWHWEFGA